MNWLVKVLDHPNFVFLVPITFLLVGGIYLIVRAWFSHKERIAMIERGMRPDAGEPKGPKAIEDEDDSESEDARAPS